MSRQEHVGFGIVGSGMAAELHARAITACEETGARLVGFASQRSDSPLSPKFNAPALTLDEMLARPDVDAVSICSPSGLHADHAMLAAQAGKHVLVEKPMALSTLQANRMISTCAQAGRLLGTVLQRRSEPLFQSVYDTVRSGGLGELICGLVSVPYKRSMDYYNSGDWRGTWTLDGGGALMNQGIHLLDLLLWWMGDPEKVYARGATLRHRIEVEDTLCATLTFPGGALASVLATTATEPGFAHRVEVYGTQGGIQIEGEEVLRWRTTAGDASGPSQDKASGAGAGSDPRGIPITGHIGIVKNFIAALRGEETLLVDGREGMRCVAAVEAIYAAAGLNRNNRTGEHA